MAAIRGGEYTAELVPMGDGGEAFRILNVQNDRFKLETVGVIYNHTHARRMVSTTDDPTGGQGGLKGI